MRAMVFGAGLGTRLRPLTELLPKPVVPFFGRPLAGWTVEHLTRAGATSVVINTHHLAERVEAALRDHADATNGPPLVFSREPQLLGTGGGLRRAWEIDESLRGAMDEDEVLVAVNGDILFAPDVRAIVSEHRARGADATLVLRRIEDPFALGAIEITPHDGRVVAMLAKERTHLEGVAAMFTGMHVLSRRALTRLPASGCVIREGYRRWLAEGLTICGSITDAPWLDLGTPRVYRDAHLDVLAGRRGLSGVAPGVRWLGDGARIEDGARILDSVIGVGARVGAVEVTRSVVWPGAVVDADVRDAIALPDGRRVPV
ncbi:MAG: NDP-sugar synthase [Deltaproteobacteria bacterium]|nr:NDP-sugar synthase [Deltaproteobacteria bacterium]